MHKLERQRTKSVETLRCNVSTDFLLLTKKLFLNIPLYERMPTKSPQIPGTATPSPPAKPGGDTTCIPQRQGLAVLDAFAIMGFALRYKRTSSRISRRFVKPASSHRPRLNVLLAILGVTSSGLLPSFSAFYPAFSALQPSVPSGRAQAPILPLCITLRDLFSTFREPRRLKAGPPLSAFLSVLRPGTFRPRIWK